MRFLGSDAMVTSTIKSIQNTKKKDGFKTKQKMYELFYEIEKNEKKKQKEAEE